jgi:hypothetical protein
MLKILTLKEYKAMKDDAYALSVRVNYLADAIAGILRKDKVRVYTDELKTGQKIWACYNGVPHLSGPYIVDKVLEDGRIRVSSALFKGKVEIDFDSIWCDAEQDLQDPTAPTPATQPPRA